MRIYESPIYESPIEQSQHEQAIEALAEELHRDIVQVQPIYERAFLDLKADAKITDDLPLFVARRTRAVFRERDVA